MESVRIGLDLGGSKLLGIIAGNEGRLLHSEKMDVPALSNSHDLADLMGTMVTRIRNGYAVESVGVSVPGPVAADGTVATLVNLGLEHINIRPLLEKRLGVPVRIGNDVNCATLAEYRYGAGRGFHSLFTLYPGTGLGGGYIQNGDLVTGLNGTAGEIGHMVVDINGQRCNCGNKGCLETLVSNIAFRRILKEKGIHDLADIYPGSSLSYGEMTEKAWHDNHPAVRETIMFQAEMMGIGIANIINLMGVDCILIGGNLYRRLGGDLLPLVISKAEEYALGNGLDGVEIKLTSLGAEAPALGTTLL